MIERNNHSNAKMWKLLPLLFILMLQTPFAFAGKGGHKEVKLKTDGPYLFYTENNQMRSISVTKDLAIVDSTFRVGEEGYQFPVLSHKGEYLFDVKWRENVTRDKDHVKAAKKIFITSDPHGDWKSFSDLLKRNKVVDSNYHWKFGKNQLVVIGDVFDRGKDVLPIFWLIYKLEEEAAKAGGQVLFLLGNHEPMVLGGDLRYMKKSYQALSDTLQIPYQKMFGPTSVLGDWLSTKNTMQLIGKNLIVHAGLSKDLIDKGYQIPQVNELVSNGLFYPKSIRRKQSEDLKFLYGNKGPIWYRGMVLEKEKYDPISSDEVGTVLNYFGADRVIVGHTIFKEISSFFNQRVIAVNVDNKKNKKKHRSRAILLKRGKIYVISDNHSAKLQ